MPSTVSLFKEGLIYSQLTLFTAFLFPVYLLASSIVSTTLSISFLTTALFFLPIFIILNALYYVARIQREHTIVKEKLIKVTSPKNLSSQELHTIIRKSYFQEYAPTVVVVYILHYAIVYLSECPDCFFLILPAAFLLSLIPIFISNSLRKRFLAKNLGL